LIPPPDGACPFFSFLSSQFSTMALFSSPPLFVLPSFFYPKAISLISLCLRSPRFLFSRPPLAPTRRWQPTNSGPFFFPFRSATFWFFLMFFSPSPLRKNFSRPSPRTPHSMSCNFLHGTLHSELLFISKKLTGQPRPLPPSHYFACAFLAAFFSKALFSFSFFPSPPMFSFRRKLQLVLASTAGVFS